METGLIAIGAGLAVGLSALATGFAQARIGAAAMGLIAEKPEMTGRAILLVAIPETLVILGFAIAAMTIVLLRSMALDDLLRAIEADAHAERELADHQTASEAAASSEQARRQASELQAELCGDTGGQGACGRRAPAPSPAWTRKRRSGRA